VVHYTLKGKRKAFGGRWVSQRRPEKGKLSLGFILLDYWLMMDEWVVAEKAIPMGMKKRIKEKVDAKMIRKQTFTKRSQTTSQIIILSKRAFTKRSQTTCQIIILSKRGKKRRKLRLSRRANHGGVGGGKSTTKHARSSYYYM
jgi:hypothetical protein